MFKRYGKRLLAVGGLTAVLAMVAAPAVYAVGLWWGLPIIGMTSYCVSQSGSGPTPTYVCTSTAPAGPTLFTGQEAVPTDILGNTNVTPSSVYTAMVQLGQGPYSIQNPPGTTGTIPSNTPWYILAGPQGSALTVTMPSSPIEGQIQRIVCALATVGTLTVAANTNQTLLGNPNAACTAGVGYAWRYVAASTTWYRYQ